MITKLVWKLWQIRDRRIMGETDPNAHDPAVHYWDYAGYLMRRFPKGILSLLDVGIGSGWLGALVGAIYHFQPDAVEGFAPYIENAKHFYGKIYNGDTPKTLKSIPSESYDVVVCLNTIEHFADPKAVLMDLERIARRRVFVSSLNYFTPSLAWDGNELQHHRSVITSKDMRALGYTISNCGTMTDNFGRVSRIFKHLDSGYLAWKDKQCTQS